MPKYQLLSCRIALSGDLGNVVVRGASRPITYPELIVLNVLHGESSISSILECGETEDTHRDVEFRRLADTYGDEIMKMLFPGHAINLPERNDRYPRDKSLAPLPPPVSPDTDEIDPQIAQPQPAPTGMKREPARLTLNTPAR